MSSAGNRKTPFSTLSEIWKTNKPVEKKVLLVDWSFFLFQSIYAWEKNESIPATYVALSSLLASLKRVGCQQTDLIILAMDSSKGSWRRQYDVNYKADRKKKREEYHKIDWNSMFKKFHEFMLFLKKSTPFIPIEIESYEADDIISVACRYYCPAPCIIISPDSDFHQLMDYNHVKIFSPKSKHYTHVKNPIATLAKKVKKETADNLITPVLTEADYIKRLKLVNLLSLPPDVELDISHHLSTIKKEEYDLTEFPYKTLESRFHEIYDEKFAIEDKVQRTKKKKMKQVDLLKEEK